MSKVAVALNLLLLAASGLLRSACPFQLASEVEATIANSQRGRQPVTTVQRQGVEEDTLRTTTTLVNVPLSVVDRRGRSVTDLRQADFKLFDNGVEQKITNFEHVDVPFTVALLLDTSGSTQRVMRVRVLLPRPSLVRDGVNRQHAGL